MRKKTNLLLWLSLSLASATFGQQTETYVIFGDTAKLTNIKIGNAFGETYSYYVSIEIYGELVAYTPNDVSEFRTSLGEVYVSIRTPDDPNKKVFYQRHEQGKISLYELHARNERAFFVGGLDGSFRKLERANFKEQLKNIFYDCDKVYPNIATAIYDGAYLSTLVENYNNCEFRRIPKMSYGAMAGMAMRSHGVKIATTNFRSDEIAPVASLWIEQPIVRSNMSLRWELTFGQIDFRKEKTIRDFLRLLFFDREVTANSPYMDLYVAIKKTSLTNNGPYVHIGPYASYLFDRTVTVIDTEGSGAVSQVPFVDNYPIRFGGMAGAGYFMHLKNGMQIFGEGRFSMVGGGASSQTVANSEMIEFMIGVGF